MPGNIAAKFKKGGIEWPLWKLVKIYCTRPFAVAILNLAAILPRPHANGPGDEIRSVNSVSMCITGTITRKAKSEAKSFSPLRVLQVDFRPLRGLQVDFII